MKTITLLAFLTFVSVDGARTKKDNRLLIRQIIDSARTLEEDPQVRWKMKIMLNVLQMCLKQCKKQCWPDAAVLFDHFSNICYNWAMKKIYRFSKVKLNVHVCVTIKQKESDRLNEYTVPMNML